jgi:ATP-dependent helicase HepA
VKKKLLPAMLAKAQAIAAERMVEVVEKANATMAAQMKEEIERLEDLRSINDHIRPEEIAALRAQEEGLKAAVASARLRLDALRLIFRTP